MIQECGGEQYIVRFARQDQYPPGTNLQDAARDSVIRYARHYGLVTAWVHDQAGTVWQWVPCEGGRYGIGVLPGGPDGSFVQKSPITVMWRSEARVIGRESGNPVRHKPPEGSQQARSAVEPLRTP
ncbi:hypothetical protein [Actinoplanes sp. ATCC 53533]|uniref:hypothetical protein n=1 Tax=Actinoplanes sp. ATCC 53533 TaxID=1288362 RepID=UPI000F7A2243|nr:hypothetical protein [Actinoplanes sp. ATCC 53533]